MLLQICEDEEQLESVVEISCTTRKPKQKKHTFVYVSSDEEEANTLKDRFWHDLEQGKMILDGSDLYSKVKSQGRSARPQSFENMFKDLRRGPSCNGDRVKINMKRNAPSSSKKSGRPHKTSKNLDTGSKKVMPKTNSDAVMAKANNHASMAKKNNDAVMTMTNYSAVITNTNNDAAATKAQIGTASLHAPDSESDEEVDTIKDRFWQDLEEGKINVFGSDLYSKVKGVGRSARPKSFQNMFKIRQPRPKKECKESKYLLVPQVLPPVLVEPQTSSSQSPITTIECGHVATDEHLVDEQTSPGSSQLPHHCSGDIKARGSVSPPVDVLEQCKKTSNYCDPELGRTPKAKVSCIGPEVSNSDSKISVICIDPEVSDSNSDLKVSVRCVDSEMSISNSDEDNIPLWCHVKPVNRDLGTSKVMVGRNDSILKTTPELPAAESSNCVLCAEPVTYGASPLSLSLSVTSMSSAASSSGYSCPTVPHEANVTNIVPTYSDRHPVAESTHSGIMNLTACSRQALTHNTVGMKRSCPPSGQIEQTGGMSTSLTSLIYLNSQPMENEQNCGAVSGRNPELVLSSRLPLNSDSVSVDYAKLTTHSVETAVSILPLAEEHPRSKTCSFENPKSHVPVVEDSKSRTCSVENIVSTMPLMKGPNSHTEPVERSRICFVENARFGMPLMEYSVPDTSSKSSKSSVEHSKLHMSFQECPGSRPSLVDWEMNVGGSVFQMNGTINVAPNCQISPKSGDVGFHEHEMSFTPIVDYSQNASMDSSRCMLSDAVLLPLGNVDCVIPPMDYFHAVSSPNKFPLNHTRRTLVNPGAVMPPIASVFNCHRDTVLRTAQTNPPLVQHTRETVGNSRSKPSIAGYSHEMQSNPRGRASSLEQNTGTDHLQHYISERGYSSSERLQDIDERFPVDIQTGLRQECPPCKQAVKPGKNLSYL